MSIFKPGDKVHLLNENLKGTITGQAANRQWLVEIEDGFEIPLDERELVHAEAQEAVAPGADALQPMPAEPGQEPSVLLVYRKGDKEDELALYLVNHLPCVLLFTVHFINENKVEGFAKGEVAPNAHLRLGLLNMQNFDVWNHIELHGLIFAPKAQSGLPASFAYSLNLNARKFIKSLSSKNPFNEEAHVFRAFSPAKEIAPIEEPERPKIRKTFTLEAPPAVVDLHIEKLVDNPHELNPADMLQQQMAYFEACIDRAIALNYEKITFIHGAGQGILKQRIRSALVKVKEVRKVRDADPVIFGGGATEVVFG